MQARPPIGTLYRAELLRAPSSGYANLDYVVKMYNYEKCKARSIWIQLYHITFENEFEFQEILLEELPNTDTLKVTVEMHSISRKYYDFLVAIALETEFNGDLFSGPPANIPSNISNGGLGFFIASAVTTEYIEISTP